MNIMVGRIMHGGSLLWNVNAMNIWMMKAIVTAKSRLIGVFLYFLHC